MVDVTEARCASSTGGDELAIPGMLWCSATQWRRYPRCSTTRASSAEWPNAWAGDEPRPTGARSRTERGIGTTMTYPTTSGESAAVPWTRGLAPNPSWGRLRRLANPLERTSRDREPIARCCAISPTARPTRALDRTGARSSRVLAVGVGVWYFVFRDTAPPAVDIDAAAESAREANKGSTATSKSAASTTTSGTTSSASSLDGTWKVDPSIGTFDVSSNTFTSAFVGYRVKEQLATVGAKTAYGRTPDVTGSLTISDTKATAAQFTAQVTTLQSDDSRRDGQLRNQAIETGRFPTATFTLTQPIDLGVIPTGETTVSVNATGDLTLHGVTKSVTIPLDAKVVGSTIVVTSLFDITFADFGIQKPSSANVLSIEDNGQMEVQLFFTRS